MAEPPVATYSLCACDLDAGQWGVVTQSKFLAVGSIVPWAAPEVGAIATQSFANARYGPDGLALLREGHPAEEVVERLIADDTDREQRQLGVVDAQGGAATFTGTGCHAWAGGRRGFGFAAQGNILVSEATVAALATSFEGSAGRSLAERLLEALVAAESAGGDRRGRQSSAILVVQRNGGYAGLSDAVVDLRVDDHPEPINELLRIYGIHDRLFGTTPRAQWVDVDDELGRELRERLARLGYESLEDWGAVENLEERIDGSEAIDPVVLEALRTAS
jgi:uncharacterized Ntn-hydrolase superfamily protein